MTGDTVTAGERTDGGRAAARGRYLGLVAASVLALLLVCTAAVAVGPADVGLSDVLASVGRHLGLPGMTDVPPLTDSIVWQLRLPRVLTAAAVGAGLALSGAVMQSVTRNPLADPYLLGLSSGASLGAVCVVILGVAFALPAAAFLGALAALVATLSIARVGGTITPGRAVLSGLAIAQLGAAGTSFVIFWSAKGDSYREILNWLLGSLAGSSWTSVLISGSALVVVGTGIVLSATRLDAFAFGDTAAASLGINVNATRWALLGAVALLTGAMVAVSGAIGFVGLILPHLVRGLSGPGHRRLLPLTVIFGALFLVVADTLARTVFDPRELPVGIITALIGVPVFIVLIKSRRAAAWA
ncbi:iron complex transport system permease protein [Cryobacterium sp. MP_M5]|uniref:putative F420-0 ABC transporter permease subunit n=1 Tax=unclassified Cryobacterium TaxID=2649013 RepID=UPI0018C8F5C9|nr:MULTISPECIES: putative F420-0 ABC transporter permease subunit [unclassified Cryobacterium]MBG6056638.1 iron complex transport system permease protein [Cryobacterium sp. MP_M3]MEC5176310.1 iron complex transport system permease protein [Cryobacterium sp. MP_M5]